MKHSGYIGNLTVRSSQNYIVYGSVRGLVGEHRTQRGAERSADKDRRACHSLGGGAYSDAQVYQWVDGWQAIQESVLCAE